MKCLFCCFNLSNAERVWWKLGQLIYMPDVLRFIRRFKCFLNTIFHIIIFQNLNQNCLKQTNLCGCLADWLTDWPTSVSCCCCWPAVHKRFIWISYNVYLSIFLQIFKVLRRRSAMRTLAKNTKWNKPRNMREICTKTAPDILKTRANRPMGLGWLAGCQGAATQQHQQHQQQTI